MILKKKISIETKREFLRLTIFLLIQAVILLIAISGVYLFIAEPMIKKVWDKIINMNDEIIIKYIKQIQQSENSLDIFTSTNNPNTTNTTNTPDNTSQDTDSEDTQIISNNEKIQKKAIEISLIIGVTVILIVTIAIFFTKYKYSSILYHSVIGFLIVITTYSLFSFLFISHYDTLDTHKAIQHFLVVANNTINPDDKITDTYKQ